MLTYLVAESLVAEAAAPQARRGEAASPAEASPRQQPSTPSRQRSRTASVAASVAPADPAPAQAPTPAGLHRAAAELASELTSKVFEAAREAITLRQAQEEENSMLLAHGAGAMLSIHLVLASDLVLGSHECMHHAGFPGEASAPPDPPPIMVHRGVLVYTLMWGIPS